MFERVNDQNRQDACWYVNSGGSEVVWLDSNKSDYYVARVGEMRIHYTSPTGDTILRYTDDLINVVGVTTDKGLELKSAEKGYNLEWVNNAWFEVISSKDKNFETEIFDELDTAIQYALELGLTGQEPDIIY